MKQFKIPETQQEAVQKHVEDLLKLRVVRPSRSKFNNPIYVVSRSNRSLRIVHNFRAINKETLLEPNSMKNLQDSMTNRLNLWILANVLEPGMQEVQGVHFPWYRSI
jgi:hypothetical protein